MLLVIKASNTVYVPANRDRGEGLLHYFRPLKIFIFLF